MPESAFNLFYFVRRTVVTEIGAVVHHMEGSEKDMGGKLRALVARDLPNVRKFSLPSKFANITIEAFNTLERLGRCLEIFERAFEVMNAPRHPFVCITAVVDGKVEIDATSDTLLLRMSCFQGHPKIGLGVMGDYLEDYATPAGLDIPRLLNDDHFAAIRLLYNNRSFLACMKLIASFIDTVGYLEHGDVSGGFVKWLDTYAKIPLLGITSAQLWELRNSLLHMSNLDSRKVLSGKEARISFFAGPRGMAPMQDANGTHFNLSDLIIVVAEGLNAWVGAMNADPDKLRWFVQRYDRVVRHAVISQDRPKSTP